MIDMSMTDECLALTIIREFEFRRLQESALDSLRAMTKAINDPKNGCVVTLGQVSAGAVTPQEIAMMLGAELGVVQNVKFVESK